MGVGRQDAPDLAGGLDATRRPATPILIRPTSLDLPTYQGQLWWPLACQGSKLGFLPSLSLLSVFGVCLPFPIQDHGGSQEGPPTGGTGI